MYLKYYSAIDQLRREHLSMNIINVPSNRCYPPFRWSKIHGGLVVIVHIVVIEISTSYSLFSLRRQRKYKRKVVDVVT